ncbi:hypothetical protein QBC40DRAFT_316548 [Triangularia verruculosa]|uniref:Low temperature requirement A n=1 Tax=Triangularia verruculosa TaxID=2587418 RepID=A0AAN6X7E8_9PEZI|nr:hypothetical protein QBC40DRAFT_316548 [Triangularia verruculosa]
MANPLLTAHSDEDSVPLMKSPVVRVKSFPKEGSTSSPAEGQGGATELDSFGWRESADENPEFEKHAEATNIEVFYDLFFAAILCVFAEVQDVTNLQQLNSFIAYFVLLWFTWALLGLFDVRFITDSIFERCVRAVHFGVMVGFAVVAPTWSLYDQKGQTYRTLSIILMASRLAMGSQYASIMWHIRGFKRTIMPMGLMVGLNVVSALVYLGVAFAFQDSTSSHLYAIWFVLTGLETLINILLSLKFQVLSYSGTHMMSRMSLLTYIFIGEGIITVLSAATKVVLNHNAWTSATIGNVAAGISNLYLIYMIYFDWRRNLKMPLHKELLWSFLHFPFQLSLKLFILGSSQFVIWWKVIETYLSTNDKFLAALLEGDGPGFNITTSWFVSTINETLIEVFEIYVPKYTVTEASIGTALAKLSEIPDGFWISINSLSDEEALENETVKTIMQTLAELLIAMQNSLFATFNVNGYAAFESDNTITDATELEQKVFDLNWGKFRLVFTYAYVAAGLTLIMMNFLYIISRTRGWTTFNYIRKALNFLVGVGLCLVTLITLNDERVLELWGTPWPLPILVITLFVILVLNHLPQPPPIFFNGTETKRPGGDKRKKEKTGWGVVRQMGFRTGAMPAEQDISYQGGGAAHPQEGYQVPVPEYQQQQASPLVSEQQRQYEQQYHHQQQQEQQQQPSQQYQEVYIDGYQEQRLFPQPLQQYHQGYQQQQGYTQAQHQQN